MTTNRDTDLLSVPNAARAAGVSQRQVYRLLNDGLISARKMGRRTFVPRVEIERFLATLPAYTPAKREAA